MENDMYERLEQLIRSGVNLVDMGSTNALFSIDIAYIITSMIFHLIYIVIGVFFGVGIIPFERVYWLTALILYFVLACIIGNFRKHTYKYINNRKKDYRIDICTSITAGFMQEQHMNPAEALYVVEEYVMPASNLLYEKDTIKVISNGVIAIMTKHHSNVTDETI